MFDKVIFAGGGSRCWWQAGFWDAVHARIELRPRLIAGVGAGAAMACLLHANSAERALAWYDRALDGPDGRWHWDKLMRAGERVLPHEDLHRKGLRALLGGDHFRDLMWTAPEIRVQFARLPAGGHPAWLTARGLAELALDRPADPREPTSTTRRVRRQGLRPEQRRIQDCQSERELVDLLIAAGSLPPFTSIGRIGDAPVLDGGLLGVPLEAVADVPGSTLVLLTRHYRDLAPVFARDGRLYVQPSRPLGVAAWDHGSIRRFRGAYALGVSDAAAFLGVFGLDRAPALEPVVERVDAAVDEGVVGEVGAAGNVGGVGGVAGVAGIGEAVGVSAGPLPADAVIGGAGSVEPGIEPGLEPSLEPGPETTPEAGISAAPGAGPLVIPAMASERVEGRVPETAPAGSVAAARRRSDPVAVPVVSALPVAVAAIAVAAIADAAIADPGSRRGRPIEAPAPAEPGAIEPRANRGAALGCSAGIVAGASGA